MSFISHMNWDVVWCFTKSRRWNIQSFSPFSDGGKLHCSPTCPWAVQQNKGCHVLLLLGPLTTTSSQAWWSVLPENTTTKIDGVEVQTCNPLVRGQSPTTAAPMISTLERVLEKTSVTSWQVYIYWFLLRALNYLQHYICFSHLYASGGVILQNNYFCDFFHAPVWRK